MTKTVVIMGAAGRDFHVFNVCYRDNPDFNVIAFTATQIPHIEDRRYPPGLAGEQYPDGIPIRDESELDDILKENQVDEVAPGGKCLEVIAKLEASKGIEIEDQFPREHNLLRQIPLLVAARPVAVVAPVAVAGIVPHLADRIGRHIDRTASDLLNVIPLDHRPR